MHASQYTLFEKTEIHWLRLFLVKLHENNSAIIGNYACILSDYLPACLPCTGLSNKACHELHTVEEEQCNVALVFPFAVKALNLLKKKQFCKLHEHNYPCSVKNLESDYLFLCLS